MKKQEEGAGEEEEETLEQCIQRKMAANAELTEEAARAACEQERRPPEAAAEKSFTDNVLAVMKEYGKHIAEEIKKEIREDMERVIKEAKEEQVEALKKGLGLSKPRYITLDQAEEMLRKMILNEKPHGKRTETPTEDKPTEGPAGAPKIKSAAEIYEELRKNRPVI